MEKFTIENAIAVQKEQLDKWKTKLKPEVFEALEEYAMEKNESAKFPYHIQRGVDLVDFIQNFVVEEIEYEDEDGTGGEEINDDNLVLNFIITDAVRNDTPEIITNHPKFIKSDIEKSDKLGLNCFAFHLQRMNCINLECDHPCPFSKDHGATIESVSKWLKI